MVSVVDEDGLESPICSHKLSDKSCNIVTMLLGRRKGV